MSGDTKLILGVIIATTVILIGAIFFLSKPGSNPVSNNQTDDQVQLQDVRDEGYNTQGPENAPVTVVEFSDFQCPACKATSPILKQLIAEYPEDIRFVYQHFPLPQHTQARFAAEAGESAGAQGYFWEMHDLLFASQEQFSENAIRDLANQIEGLDVEQFNKDLDEHTYLDKVTGDLANGNRAGVNSTPSIYINGVKFAAPASLDNLKSAVEQELATFNQFNFPENATDSGELEEATPSAE